MQVFEPEVDPPEVNFISCELKRVEMLFPSYIEQN